MSLKAMYDTIATNYAPADRFGSISLSHQTAIAQIQSAHLGHKNNYKILDLGVGDGGFLKKIRHVLPDAQYTGIDISSEMLKTAKNNLELTTIEASAAEASHFLPQHSQDLVLAHFINAYIPIHTLFEQARMLSKATGHFSMITTTYDSFPLAQQYLADFIAKDTLVSSVVGHYYKSIIKNTTVATNQIELFNAFKEHEFKIIEKHRLEIPITLNNIDELGEFGIEGTWFLNTLAIRMLPKNFLLARLRRLFSHMFSFPYHDTHVIDIVLASK